MEFQETLRSESAATAQPYQGVGGDREHEPSSSEREPRVAIAHDYLTQRGGAERVVLAFAHAFPDAEILTSVYNAETTYPEFRQRRIRTSWLTRVPQFRTDPRRALPLLGLVWSAMEVGDVDVVLCSSTGWAHGLSARVPKVVYCHNPARWLYQSEDYGSSTGRTGRLAMNALSRPLRAWDRRAAHSAAVYVANSSVVAGRIVEAYGIQASVLNPPAAISGGALEAVPGIAPGFLLTVGRSRGYKNTAAVAEAVAGIEGERLVAVGGVPEGNWPDRIKGLSDLTDAQMRWLYANAAALVACAREDFGLTPIEAYGAGTPAVVLRSGGYLDTTVDGVTGEFAEDSSPAAIAAAIRRLRTRDYDSVRIKHHAASFGLDQFTARIRGIVYQAADRRPPSWAA